MTTRPATRRAARAGLLSLLAASTALSLGGCSVPVGTIVAIGATETGSPVAHMVVCDGTVDTAVLYEAKSGKVVGRWTVDQHGKGDSLSFPLDSPSDGWVAEEPAFTGLLPNRAYELRAYGGQNGDTSVFNTDAWASSYVVVTGKQVAGLQPDQVRYWAGTDEGGMRDLFATASIEEFERTACDGW